MVVQKTLFSLKMVLVNIETDIANVKDVQFVKLEDDSAIFTDKSWIQELNATKL